MLVTEAEMTKINDQMWPVGCLVHQLEVCRKFCLVKNSS